jgi:glycosyltransferase involved in cell wall biosynthesis
MRIAYLSTFYPYRGGIAQFNASLFREFEKNHDIKAFTFTRQYPNILFPGKTQYVTNDENADAIQSIRKLDTLNPYTYLSTAKAINKFAPDILIMKYWMSYFGPSLGTVAKLMKPKTKVITILDNVIPHEKKFFDMPFTKYFLKQNDGFIAMSKSVKTDLHTLQPNANVLLKEHPLYNHFGKKIDKKEACDKLKIKNDKKTLLFFGFIRDYKGLDLLIDAFGRLENNYQLVIAGETYGSFEKYQQQINKLPNKENVYVFNDYISDEQVPLFFSASDVCILPYKSATQSGITSIAYHFDLPIIATDTGGLKETIQHNLTGIIVDEISPGAICSAILRYFDQQLQQKFLPEIQNIKANLSWEKFAQSIVNFNQSLP